VLIKQSKYLKKIYSSINANCIINSDYNHKDDPNGKNFISRADFVNLLDVNKSILEIGPYFNPTFTKKSARKIKYSDVLDKNNLILKAKKENLDISRIPEIDYVNPTGDLSIVKEKFDIVFSSHNIEHQVDLIRHLQQVSNLLKQGGKFYLFIPDKRFCFDHFIAESTLVDVLEVYKNKSKTHSLGTIMTMSCLTTHNDPTRHWKGDHGQPIEQDNINCYKEAFSEYDNANGSYIDSHKWRFTPENFTHIIENLNKINLIDLKIEKIYSTMTNSHEFSVILQKVQ
jgi:SAM-dependent methyltransferase